MQISHNAIWENDKATYLPIKLHFDSDNIASNSIFGLIEQNNFHAICFAQLPAAPQD